MVFGDPKRIPLKQRYLETAFCHSEQKPLQKSDFKLVVFTDPLGNLRFQQDYSQENLELDTSRYGRGLQVRVWGHCATWIQLWDPISIPSETVQDRVRKGI